MTPLKEATAVKHKQAERMPFNAKMIQGKLSKSDYLNYLEQQLAIFQTIEANGLPSITLARVPAIQADINELKAEGVTSSGLLPATKKYSDHIDNLTYEESLPHIYLNYLALMYGGQMIKKAVPSSGKMYDFENPQEAIQSIRAIQKDEWADEANRGFDFLIEIFDQLDSKSEGNS